MAAVAELTPSFAEEAALDAIDRELVVATQSGLPLVPRPYHFLAEQLGISPEEVMQRIQCMLERRIIRRIAAVPNHYALGFKANGMSVWNVPDERVPDCGRKIGALEFVSHCYHRPRHPPIWNYNLFAMVHGRTRVEVEDKVAAIAALLGADNQGHEILYSTRILKKTGLRLTNDFARGAG
jgi:DNA-binding Lrp family transcriptional regulator